MTAGISYSVAYNPWLTCSLLLAFRFFLPGMAWGWIFRGVWGERPLWSKCILSSAIATFIGVTASLLSSALLAETGLYKEVFAFGFVAVYTLAGIILGLIFDRARLWEYSRSCLPGLLILLVGTAVIMNIPRRGEWILGGWDPGIYVSQGINAAETETFRPPPDGAYSRLRSEELQYFTRNFQVYIESFPGTPVNRETGAHEHYFFRLTPTLVSILARCGGLRAATRMNLIVGLLSCFAFAAMLLANRCKPPHMLFALFILMSQPVWLAHLQLPVSEMLQLFLVCGIGALIPCRKTGSAPLVLLAFLIAASIVNRFSFFPFTGVLLLAVALGDFTRNDRDRVWIEHTIMIAGMACGILYDVVCSRITVMVIGSVLNAMIYVMIASLVLVLAVDAVAMSGKARRIPSVCPGWTRWAACLLVPCVVAGAAMLFKDRPAVSSTLSNVFHMIPFFGWAFTVAAVIGAFVLLCRRNCLSTDMKSFLLFLLAVSFVLFIHKHIKDIYPWSTRRYLVYTVPAIAISVGYLLSLLWGLKGNAGLYGRIASLVCLVAMTAETAKTSWHAWSRTEYDGISAVLAQAAAHVRSNDIVLADHPWWGTPLTFIYGKQVLNGRPFYSRNETTSMDRGMYALHRLRSEGTRIRFLTSTADGLGIYPMGIESARLDWESEEVALDEFTHSPKADDFVTHQRKFIFRLYTWGK